MPDILASPEYSPHFSGHETFPLRQMWLKKAFDQVDASGKVPRTIFSDDDAIARFGVGKNMVAAIKHWALACSLIVDVDVRSPFEVTEIGRRIFSGGGLDPYSEDPTTAWYVHWCLAGRGNRSTTWFWLFNCVTAQLFSRDDLVAPLTDYARRRSLRLAHTTLTRDIETCIRSYAPRAASGSPEDYAEPMLGELGLIQEERKGLFSFRRGPKISLSDGMFVFALLDYWDHLAPGETTLAFEAITYGVGSPGRVFKLDEDSVAERLFGLAALTDGRLTWSDNSGLRQVHRRQFDAEEMRLEMLGVSYV